MNPLPVEIIERILKHCDKSILLQCRWVSSEWLELADPMLPRRRFLLIYHDRPSKGDQKYTIHAMVDAMNLGEAISAFIIRSRHISYDIPTRKLWWQYIACISDEHISPPDRKVDAHQEFVEWPTNHTHLEWLQFHPREFMKRLIDMHKIQLPDRRCGFAIILGISGMDTFLDATYPETTLPYLSWRPFR